MNIKVYSQIKEKIKEAEVIIIGAGAGLSTAAGVNYGTANFSKLFPELVKTYGFTDMYTSSFYNFASEEERWSYWAKHINYLCVGMKATDTYKKLYELFKDKNYFVITTNVDRQFLKAGFDSRKVFEVQGALTKIQCANACHDKLYDNTNLVKEMLEKDYNCKIPFSLVPKCPICGGMMEVNLRKDNFFVEDDYWEEHNNSYERFINDNKDKKILFLELGVGFNTPGIIRYPFEDLTKQLDNAFLIRINDKFANVPNDIEDKSFGIQDDIKEIIKGVSDIDERKSKI
jgi:NAD-dependent SIR2 family protein deacetylase